MLAHKRFKEKVPVVNKETGQEVGVARPSSILAAHLHNNSVSCLKFEGRYVACIFDPDNPTEIQIFPTKDL